MSVEMDLRTLGLPPGSDWEQVKSAFRRLARTYHPDVAGPEHSRRFAEITRAYMALKESIQDGAAPVTSSPRSPEAPARSRRRRRGTSRSSSWWHPGRLMGGLRSLWRTGREVFTRRRADGEARSPARDRFVEEALGRAEMRFDQLRDRRGVAREEALRATLRRRLESRHPGVVLLALEELARSGDPGFARRSLAEHLGRELPDPEALHRVLALFPGPDPEGLLTRSLGRWGNLYAPSEALSVLRWGRGREGRREWLRPFLTNPSREVAAGALQQWPPGSGLPETSDLLRLFRQEDEVLLVPLLRLVRREGMVPWMRPQLERWGRSHASAPVRVWAAAIVRDQSVR